MSMKLKWLLAENFRNESIGNQKRSEICPGKKTNQKMTQFVFEAKIETPSQKRPCPAAVRSPLEVFGYQCGLPSPNAHEHVEPAAKKLGKVEHGSQKHADSFLQWNFNLLKTKFPIHPASQGDSPSKSSSKVSV